MVSLEQSRSAVPWRYRPSPGIPEDLRAQPTAQERQYLVGTAAVSAFESAWGRSTETFSPEVYGQYAATSDLIYAAASIRAKNIGKLPVRGWKRRRDGSLAEVTQVRPGSLAELLQRVNPFWSTRRMLRMIEWARVLWGQAFAVVNRGPSGLGTPTELWWVRPDRMRVVPHETDYIAGFIYEHQGTRIPFQASEVLWFPLDNPIDEFAGLSPIAPARLSVETANAASRANRNIFTNGLMAGGIITPNSDSEIWGANDIELIQELLRTRAQGDANAHRFLILSRLLKLQSAALSPAEMQYIEQLRWSVAVVARVTGVPAGILQDREHSTYNNLDQDHEFLWQETLVPEAEDIGDVLTEFLAPMFPGEMDSITLDYSNVPALQEDRAALTLQAQRWWRMGVPLNRLLQEMAPYLLDENGGGYEWGNEPSGVPALAAATADTPADADVDPDAAPEPEDATDASRLALAAFRQIYQAEQQRMEYGSDEHAARMRRVTRAMDRHEKTFKRELLDLFRRQQESVLARLRKRGLTGYVTRNDDDAADMPFDMEQWTETFAEVMLPIVESILEDAGAEALDDIGVSSAFDLTNPEIRKWLENALFQFAADVNSTTIEALRDALQEGIDNGLSIDELADVVKEVFGGIADHRADAIARTETTEAVNAGTLEGYRQSGVVSGKAWLAALDDRTRESHVDAHDQQRGIDEPFDVGGSQLQFPGDGALGAGPEELVNCRCTLTAILDDGRMLTVPLLRRP